jgi:hypothetical protein
MNHDFDIIPFHMSRPSFVRKDRIDHYIPRVHQRQHHHQQDPTHRQRQHITPLCVVGLRTPLESVVLHPLSHFFFAKIIM